MLYICEFGNKFDLNQTKHVLHNINTLHKHQDALSIKKYDLGLATRSTLKHRIQSSGTN
jgi:hypothetical protein